MTEEDEEFERIERESKVRMMAARYAMERAEIEAKARMMAARYAMEQAKEQQHG
jgi:hypothetical protein